MGGIDRVNVRTSEEWGDDDDSSNSSSNSRMVMAELERMYICTTKQGKESKGYPG
jgi:hypothetical protein